MRRYQLTVVHGSDHREPGWDERPALQLMTPQTRYFPDRLQCAREARGWGAFGIRDFARQMGVTVRDVRRYERGHALPDAAYMDRIAELTHYPLAFFAEPPIASGPLFVCNTHAWVEDMPE